MKKQRKKLSLSQLSLNEGQLGWLPTNPRQWTDGDIKRTAASIKEDTDFLEDRPILVVPDETGSGYVVFAGNLRYTGAKEAGLSEVPCVIHTIEDEETDRQTIKRRAMKDNGSFGSWDYDELANSWDDCPLVEWGVPAWEVGRAASDLGLTTKGKEGEEGYDEFVEKFQQKLTTDDCYTPPAVYDAVLEFVGKLTSLENKKIDRPFVPGGDYEAYAYRHNSIVVDNPPFSILSKIVRFYCGRNIPFFLFAPALVLFRAVDCDVTYIVADAHIVYENGADVPTGFITNLIPDLRVWVCPELRELIEAAQPDEDKTKQSFVYPDNIITAAILGKIAKRGVEFKVRKRACEYIKQSDSAEAQGRELFGGGFIMSDRAAAERAAATRLTLSDRERAIIEALNEQDKD